MSVSTTRKSNISPNNDDTIQPQEQPESSSSSSTQYQKSRSDDLAPILPQQKLHSSTTTETIYHVCEEDASSSSKRKDGQYHQHHQYYQRESLGASLSEGKNKAITSWLSHCPVNNEKTNNTNNIYQEEQQQNADSTMDDCPSAFLGSFITILFIESVIIIVLEGFRVQQGVYQSSQCILSMTGVGVSFTNLIYRALVISISLYQLLLCVDTLRQRSAAQLYALILFGFLFVIFAIIQIYQNQSIEEWMVELKCIDEASRTVGPHYEYAILAVIPACFLVLIGCSVWLHRLFTWHHRYYWQEQQSPSSITATVENSNNHQNPRLRKAVVTLVTLLALIKIDLFFCFSFAVQLSPSALLHYETTTMEALLVAGLGAVVFIIAYYGILNEKPHIIGVATLAAAISIAYFVFRLITFAQPHLSSSGQDPYRATRYSLIYTLLVLIILTTLTTGVAVATIRSMMHGIRILQGSANRQNNNTYMAQAVCCCSDHGKPSSSPMLTQEIGAIVTK